MIHLRLYGHAPLTLLLCIAMCACSVASEEALTIQPIDVSQFVVTANARVGLKFLVDAPLCRSSIEYIIQDYAGEEEGGGVVRCHADAKTIDLDVKLHRGYHEIRFAKTGSIYGVIALDRLNERVDEFFGIDTAFSYLESSAEYRAQYIGQLTRLGIGAVRDRINWNELHPDRGEWNGSEKHRFDEMRRIYANADIKVVDVLHDLPAGVNEYFPIDSAQVSAISLLATHWGDVWSGVEVANEPDHNHTYDGLSIEQKGRYQRQYAAYTALASLGIKQTGLTVPVVGGAFAYPLAGGKVDSSAFASGVAAAGVLRSVDVISFHTYVETQALPNDVRSFQAWIRHSGASDIPLWITESGWPWKRGPGRPPLDQDQASALQIAGKAIVAYNMGIQRYYAFVYPYYEEKEKNFGMTGKERTPLRSLAAYEQAAKALSGARTFSGARGTLGQGSLAMMFKVSTGGLMVAYGQKPGACFDLPYRPLKAQGIDGRTLVVEDKRVCAPDGLAYIWMAEADVPQAAAVIRATSGAPL